MFFRPILCFRLIPHVYIQRAFVFFNFAFDDILVSFPMTTCLHWYCGLPRLDVGISSCETTITALITTTCPGMSDFWRHHGPQLHAESAGQHGSRRTAQPLTPCDTTMQSLPTECRCAPLSRGPLTEYTAQNLPRPLASGMWPSKTQSGSVHVGRAPP